MEFGKHVTTSPELALTWGKKLVEWGRASSVGRILEIGVPADLAELVDFVGANTDGVGACYFIQLEQLALATITEVQE